MAELNIPLASNEITLRKEDLSRAMFCALAISQEDDVKEVKDKLKQHPDLQFEEIHISVPNLDGEPIQKFVVASTEDIIFIAFQGMVTPTDFIISDLEFDEQLGVNFHKGFFTRSNVFYGGQSPYRHLLLEELLSSKRRVIFCGHSLGGAVSHMVLLRFLLENRLHHPKPDDYFQKFLDSMISIAFGAPPLCDAKAATLVNDNPDFKWRFVNFVNQMDLVPRLLQRYPPDSAELQKFHRDISMPNTTNTDAVNEQHPSGQCTYPNQQGGRGAVKLGNYNPDLIKSRLAQGAKINLLPCTNKSKTASDISANSRYSITVTPDITGGAEFHPIGQYIFLNQNGKNDVHRVDGRSAEISELLKFSQFDRAAWERHKAARYKEALTGSEDSAQPQPLTTVVKSPLPHVQYAKFRSTDAGDSFLKIRGGNLLFLSEPVSLNGMPCVDNLYQTQNELWVSEPKEFSKQGASQDANYMVSIKTAFGRASRLVIEDFVEEPHTTAALNLLPKIWQYMLVTAQKPEGIIPKTEDLNTLDEIIQCAFEQEVETKLSCRLRLIAGGKDPSNHVQEADKFIKDDVVKKFLTSSLRIEYKSSTYTDDIKNAVGGLGFATQATMTGMAAGMVYTETIAGVATTMAVTATLTVMTAGLGVLAGVLTVVAVRSAISKSLNYVRNIESYEEVLDLAIREAKAWKSPQESDEATMPMEQRINKEHELKCQVDESDDTFYEMVEKANDSNKTVHQLKAPEFGAAKTESMNKFLRRIKMIVEIRPFYDRLVKRRFVGILGAEDIGKSTFIKVNDLLPS
ncbi:hypothetical protein BDL97_13G117600 [Sphagnum fallax]|nr:hypothetical protein BDL97_13G117600 [Sphagnum fallax]